MSVAARHLDRLRAARLHGLVQRRAVQAAPEVWADYTKHLEILPQLLRHNGLGHTVAYLRLLADRNGRDSQAARDLIADWLESPAGNHHGWHLQAWTSAGPGGTSAAGAGNPVDARAEYRHASRLALREADWLRRFVQSVPVAQDAAPARPDDDDDDTPAEDD